jgi:hypothetical protein
MDRKALIERRQLKRFNAQDGAFAVTRNHVSKLGQIMRNIPTGHIFVRSWFSFEEYTIQNRIGF